MEPDRLDRSKPRITGSYPAAFSSATPPADVLSTLDGWCYSNVTRVRSVDRRAGQAQAFGGHGRRTDGHRPPLQRRASDGNERSRNVSDAQGLADLTRDSGPLTAGSSAATNLWAGGMLVYVNSRPVYVNAHVIQAADCDERSRNIIDTEGPRDLCRSK